MWQKLPWLLIILVGLLVLIMGGIAMWLLRHENAQLDDNRPNKTLLEEREEKTCGLPAAESVAATETILVSGVGFNPAEVAIKIGQTVRWVNNGSSVRRVVVAPHPLHDQCLGLDSKSLDAGDSFGFTFTKPGEWVVHDESQLLNQSKIIVTE